MVLGTQFKQKFFHCRELTFGLKWKALFQGRIIGQIDMDTPELNLVITKTKEDTGASMDIGKQIQDFSPVTINSITINHGSFRFQDPSKNPDVDLTVDHIEMQLSHLSNRKDRYDTSLAQLHLTALVLSQAPLKIKMQFDPLASPPHFDLDFQLDSLQIPKLNDFNRAYLNMDVESGIFYLKSELASRDGNIEGYVKPIVRELNVFDWKKDVEQDNKGFFKSVWEMGIDVVEEIFQNQDKQQTATRIPIKGKLTTPKTDMVTTTLNVLYNAFIQAFKATLEHSISAADLK